MLNRSLYRLLATCYSLCSARSCSDAAHNECTINAQLWRCFYVCLTEAGIHHWLFWSATPLFAEAFALEAPQIKIFLSSLSALITSLPKEHSSLSPKSCCCAGCIYYCAAGPHNKDQLSLMRPVLREMAPVALRPPHPHPKEFINMFRERTVCWDWFRLFQLIPVTPKLSKLYCFTFTCVIYWLLFVYMWFPIKYGTKCLSSTWHISTTTLLSSYCCCPPPEEFFFIKAMSDAAQSRTQDRGAAKIMWPTIKIKYLVGTQQG